MEQVYKNPVKEDEHWSSTALAIVLFWIVFTFVIFPAFDHLTGTRPHSFGENAIRLLVSEDRPPNQQPSFIYSKRERALRNSLGSMRMAINRFHENRGKYPATLNQLVQENYLSKVPKDPFSKKVDWNYSSKTGTIHSKSKNNHIRIFGPFIRWSHYSDW